MIVYKTTWDSFHKGREWLKENKIERNIKLLEKNKKEPPRPVTLYFQSKEDVLYFKLSFE